MTNPANDRYPLLTGSEIIAHHAEPLIGELRLTTDHGDIVLAINKDAAAALIEELETFLDTE